MALSWLIIDLSRSYGDPRGIDHFLRLDRCASAGILPNNTLSHDIINRAVDLLSIVHCILLAVPILLCFIFYRENVSIQPMHRKVLVFCRMAICVLCSVCCQLINSFICHPAEILYDPSFMSMIFIRIVGLILSLFFCFIAARI